MMEFHETMLLAIGFLLIGSAIFYSVSYEPSTNDSEDVFLRPSDAECSSMMEGYRDNITSCRDGNQSQFDCAWQSIHTIGERAEQCPRMSQDLCQQRNDYMAGHYIRSYSNSTYWEQDLNSSMNWCQEKVSLEIYDENITASLEMCRKSGFSCETKILEKLSDPDRISEINITSFRDLCDKTSESFRSNCRASIGHIFAVQNISEAMSICGEASGTRFDQEAEICKSRVAEVVAHSDYDRAKKLCEGLDRNNALSCYNDIQ